MKLKVGSKRKLTAREREAFSCRDATCFHAFCIFARALTGRVRSQD
jgi:hypothetical protein